MKLQGKHMVCLLLAAVSALLGLIYLTVYRAVRFSGFLLCCIGLALLVFVLLDRGSGKSKLCLWLKRILLAVLAAGLLLFGAMEVWVVKCAVTDSERSVSAVVVLGAGVNGTVPSLSLQTRLEAALAYLADKPGLPVVVTGSQGPGEEISEARCMADWLTARGVAPERILLEEQADNTEENIRFSRQLLREQGVDITDNIAVVSADYHLCRAAWLWGPEGNMVPVAAHMPRAYWPLTVNYFVREAFAMAAEVLLR